MTREKELEIPIPALGPIIAIILDNGLTHTLAAVEKTHKKVLTITFEYSREERKFIQEIEGLVEDYLDKILEEIIEYPGKCDKKMAIR